MANRYWVGGSATWDTTAGTKWALTSGGAGGQAIPTAADDVYFDSGSGVVTVTVGTGAVCKNLSFTSGAGSFAGTFQGSSALAISGNLTMVAGMTHTYTGAITFNSTAAQTITSAGKTIESAVTFNGVGGEWQLQDAFTMGATRQLTLTAGTIDLNSKNLTARNLSSTGTGVRSIKFGTGEMFLTGSALTAVGLNDATNFTFTGTGGFNLSYSGAIGTRTCRFGSTAGGSATNAPNIKISAGTDSVSMSPSSWNNVDYTGFAGTVSAFNYTCYGNFTCPSGVTFTGSSNPLTFAATTSKTIATGGSTIDSPIAFNGVAGTWTFQDALTMGAGRILTLTNGTVKLKNGVTSTVGGVNTSGTDQKFLQSALAGSQATISDNTGTNNLLYTTIQDIAVTGGAVWNALNGSLNYGNNNGWFFAHQQGKFFATRAR